ncbi:hypothetical protein DFO67_13517 [Modicisalibacter xianhensis]|uniref:Uncharacterized protein n=1 Tax=Modicisalibacter xianhensis TaxID=442341 RepID=A0A4R8FFM6_9GAMM|nr:hypothetical protein [Halomonas xianhensis]TDX21607.1 hypothetical protein DFO67_13517 [Halomonas xianhensis]
MIRMTANIAGHEVELTGNAAEVVAELEELRKALEAPAPAKKAKPKKTGPGTHDEQPDLPLKEADPEPTPEPQPEPQAAQEPPTVSDSSYNIEDIRAALKDADEDTRAAAKAFIAQTIGKPYLPDLPAEHYPELMRIVGGEK